MEGLKYENGEGQLTYEPYELFRVVLTTTHLIAEMAAVSILHVEEFPPLYHRSSDVRGLPENIYLQRRSEGMPRAFQFRYEIGMNEGQRVWGERGHF